VLAAATYALTILGRDEDADLTGDLDISGRLSLVGVSAAQTILQGTSPTNGGQAPDRALHVLAGANVTVRNLTIEHAGGLVAGGGIENQGVLTLDGTAIQNNLSAGGSSLGLPGAGPATGAASTTRAR
jgi:hypothetical protein